MEEFSTVQSEIYSESSIKINAETKTNRPLSNSQFGQRSISKRILKRRYRKHKITLMFLLITATVILSFIPRLALMVVEVVDMGFWDDLSDAEYLICLCFYRLYLLNNVTNPIIYYVFDTAFTKGLKRALKIK